MKKIICLLFWFSSVLNAQSDDHHRKYWYYRTRLNNDFVKVGTNQGESLPFNQRGYSFDGDLSNKGHKAMHAGDVTSTLGYYIGVLATEFALLSHNGQKTDSVRHELFCALNAFNRLDFNAEALFRTSHTTDPGDLNGFFIRDDISQNFLADNYSHFNYFNNSSNSFGNA